MTTLMMSDWGGGGGSMLSEWGGGGKGSDNKIRN